MDHSNGDQFVFETGAIMWYLCEKEAKGEEFWPKVRMDIFWDSYLCV